MFAVLFTLFSLNCAIDMSERKQGSYLQVICQPWQQWGSGSFRWGHERLSASDHPLFTRGQFRESFGGSFQTSMKWQESHVINWRNFHFYNCFFFHRVTFNCSISTRRYFLSCCPKKRSICGWRLGIIWIRPSCCPLWLHAVTMKSR